MYHQIFTVSQLKWGQNSNLFQYNMTKQTRMSIQLHLLLFIMRVMHKFEQNIRPSFGDRKI